MEFYFHWTGGVTSVLQKRDIQVSKYRINESKRKQIIIITLYNINLYYDQQ